MCCRRLAFGALVALLAANGAASVRAAGIRSPVPLSARARLDLKVMAAEGTAPWSWDAQSRSPLDGSRFMTDLTAGDEPTGTLYLKGAANWRDSDDAAGRVKFVLEQGDYLFRRAVGGGTLSALVFGDERRYFTGQLGVPTSQDDVVESWQHRFGAQLGGTHGDFGADYLVSVLDAGRDEDLVQRGAVRWSAPYVYASVTYQHTRPDQGEDRAVAQAEAAGTYRWITAIVSYAQSGTGSGFFFPSGSFEGGGGYVAASPGNSATYAEARLKSVRAGDVILHAVYRYDVVGVAYVNELAAGRPGSVCNSAGLYASHRRYALDGRLQWRDETRYTLESSRRRGLEATARAFLNDNSQFLLRAAAERREFHGSEEYDAGLVQGGYRRELQRFMGGVQLMLDGIGQDATPRAAIEARLNWSATSAFYARWMLAGRPEEGDAVYARLEFRPTDRTWVTLAYGWSDAGDSPYLFDDRATLPPSAGYDVITLTVRGDF